MKFGAFNPKMGNTVLGPANTAKYTCRPNTFQIHSRFDPFNYNPGRASNTNTAINTYFPSRQQSKRVRGIPVLERRDAASRPPPSTVVELHHEDGASCAREMSHRLGYEYESRRQKCASRGERRERTRREDITRVGKGRERRSEQEERREDA